MALLTAAVIVLTVLVAVDLVLSAAVIRRLKETEARLEEITGGAMPGPEIGSALPELTEDAPLAQSDLLGAPTILGFFATGCRYCPPQADALLQKSAVLEQAGIRVISVLVVAEGQEDELTPTLDKAGRLVTEVAPGTLKDTFGVMGTPTFLRYDASGVLTAQGNALGDVLDS